VRPALEWLEDRLAPATLNVTTAADELTPNDGTVSLREAITAINAGNNLGDPDIVNTGAAFGTNDTIDFNIGGGGPQTISLQSALPTVTGRMTIDGTSQPGFAGTPLIVLDGTGAGAGVSGLTITAGFSTVKGLVIDNFAGNGVVLASGSNVVAGDYIGVDSTGTAAAGNGGDGVVISGATTNTVGGTTASARNIISGNGGNGVDIFNAFDNWVADDYIGTDVTGTAALGNGNDGVAVHATGGSSYIYVGNSSAVNHNVISGNTANGVDIFGSGATNISVQGDYIGTDVTGTAALGNGNDGVAIHDGASGNTVGGTTAAARNVISANTANGVNIFTAGAGTTGNLVKGDYIGTDVSGTAALGNAANGVLVTAAGNNTVGGTASGAGNVIAFSGNDGVLVDTGTGNAVRRNSIHDSTNLGIELVNNGNANQPAPALTSAVTGGSSITIQGTLTAAAGTSYALDFFASPAANASGAGEGQQLLGSATVTTNAGGTVSFTVTFTASVPAGQAVSATATSPAGNTSAFAQDVTATARTGLVIVPTFDSSITNDPNAAAIENTINTAIQAYENAYSNPITVQIYFEEMSSGLGQSNTGVVYDATYAGFRSGLAANQASSGQSDQATALAHLPNQTNNPVTGNADVAVTPANGRALGLNTPGLLDANGNVNTGGTFDGIIGLRTALTFPPQPNNGSNYSLLAVTEHEIDEVLGTGSALPGSFNFGNGPSPKAEDLYRYAAGGARSYTSATATAYFSLDGTTDLVQFHNANDGADYGDWQNQAGNPRVQDAFGTPGATPSLGVELTALDVLGYDRFPSGPAGPSQPRGNFPAGPGTVPPALLVGAVADAPGAIPGLLAPTGVADGAAAASGPALPAPPAPLLAPAAGRVTPQGVSAMPAPLLALAPAAAGPSSPAGLPPAAPQRPAPAPAAGPGVTGPLDRFLADAADDLGAALAGAHAAPTPDDWPGALVEALAAPQSLAWK
jgi:CSLREA domain-containing protein